MTAKIGIFVIPTVLFFLILYGTIRRVPLYDAFLEGAKEGALTAFRIMPAIVAILTAIGMMKASGLLESVVGLLSPLCSFLGIPAEVAPLAVIRPVSGSGGLAVLEQLLSDYGPDSLIGRTASVLQSSTETTFYTLAVYCGAVGISKTGYALPCALTADFCGMIFAAAAVRLLM